jgi:uncharacterized membrane protein
VALDDNRLDRVQPDANPQAADPSQNDHAKHFDGIVLHQIVQWHHLVSAVYAPDTLSNLRLNTRADGVFHAATWLFTVLGLGLVWSGTRGEHVPWRTSVFIGTLLFGFGLFNVVEGLTNHQLLGVHHVRPGPDQRAYDVGFLIWGGVMLLVGGRLTRAPLTDVPTR